MPSPETDQIAAYQQGRDAKQAGRPATANPYAAQASVLQVLQYQSWLAGWASLVAPDFFQSVEGEISTAEMNNLFSVPKVVIPDSAALGKWLVPVFMTWAKEAGLAYNMNGSAGLQLYGGVPQGAVLCRIDAAGNLGAAFSHGQFFNIPSSLTATVFNGFSSGFAPATFGVGLQWGCPTANFSGGTGRFRYRIRYILEDDFVF